MPTYAKPATKADIQGFRDWLTTQSGVYDKGNSYDCVIAQYLKAATRKDVGVGTITVLISGNNFAIPIEISKIAYGYGSLHGYEYFGRALERANQILAKMT